MGAMKRAQPPRPIALGETTSATGDAPNQIENLGRVLRSAIAGTKAAAEKEEAKWKRAHANKRVREAR